MTSGCSTASFIDVMPQDVEGGVSGDSWQRDTLLLYGVDRDVVVKQVSFIHRLMYAGFGIGEWTYFHTSILSYMHVQAIPKPICVPEMRGSEGNISGTGGEYYMILTYHSICIWHTGRDWGRMDSLSQNGPKHPCWTYSILRIHWRSHHGATSGNSLHSSPNRILFPSVSRDFRMWMRAT